MRTFRLFLVVAMLVGSTPQHGRSAGSSARLYDEYRELAVVLKRSCSGKKLVKALKETHRSGADFGLSLLVQELEREVEARTGLLADQGDPRLIDAATTLRRLPRGAFCEPVVAVMGLIDEWAAQVTGTAYRRERVERFVEKVRGSKLRKDEDLGQWLQLQDSDLYSNSREILDYLTPRRDRRSHESRGRSVRELAMKAAIFPPRSRCYRWWPAGCSSRSDPVFVSRCSSRGRATPATWASKNPSSGRAVLAQSSSSPHLVDDRVDQ